jgi:hypothetical protein
MSAISRRLIHSSCFSPQLRENAASYFPTNVYQSDVVHASAIEFVTVELVPEAERVLANSASADRNKLHFASEPRGEPASDLGRYVNRPQSAATAEPRTDYNPDFTPKRCSRIWRFQTLPPARQIRLVSPAHEKAILFLANSEFAVISIHASRTNCRNPRFADLQARQPFKGECVMNI